MRQNTENKIKGVLNQCEEAQREVCVSRAEHCGRFLGFVLVTNCLVVVVDTKVKIASPLINILHHLNPIVGLCGQAGSKLVLMCGSSSCSS